MTQTIYAKDLGKCYAKEGSYRAYKEGGLYALYMVGRETLWSDNGSSFRLGNRLEAVKVGYFTDLENFGMAVDSAKEELAYLMAEVSA